MYTHYEPWFYHSLVLGFHHFQNGFARMRNTCAQELWWSVAMVNYQDSHLVVHHFFGPSTAPWFLDVFEIWPLQA